MISNEKLAETSLRTLSAEGIAISLDDFGTGYSSLSLLHKLSFNKLKIDNSFVRSMTKDNRSRDIVESTILMASQLGLATCAEGVEDEKTLRMLEQAGCDLVQGFFLARPGPGLNLPNQERLITEVA
jgi:EAL domain-containing protein (putative c-di-GMP-specific phosphodiesterase class I)